MDKRPVDVYCMDCMFYFDEEIPDTVGCGECRYGPPTALPIFGHGYYHSRAFPLVSEYDWCWRYQEDVKRKREREEGYEKIRNAKSRESSEICR